VRAKTGKENFAGYVEILLGIIDKLYP